MTIKFLDLQKQYQSIKSEIDRAITKVLDDAHFILGQEVGQLEKQVAKYCQTKYAVGLNSGTDALLLSLMALDIKKGDEIITTPFTFVATADVIALRGLKPVFVDIDPQTYNIDATKIERAITKRTKAIIAVHLFGQPVDMKEVMQLARQYKLKVIEDCAQAIGARYMDQPVGSIGDIGCLSFFPSKNLGAYGDAGMVITNDKKLADKIRLLRVHGARKKYYHDDLGINSRLDTLQAAILMVKLKKLNQWIKGRQIKARYYDLGLSKIKNICAPFRADNRTHVYHQYTLGVKNRNNLQKYLYNHGIETVVYYPLALHLQPVFNYLGYKKGDFPWAEKAAQTVLSLPLYPELTLSAQNKVIRAIQKFFKLS